MIAQAKSQDQPVRWQQELVQAISNPIELLRLLDLDPTRLPEPLASENSFRLRVPRGYVARMRKGDPQDPLLRQVLPLAAEDGTVPGYVTDPVGDLQAQRVPGVLRKYLGRALIVTTGACAIHCRYCFRRHYPYCDSNPAADQWRQALRYLAAETSINEVILSGGDPLILSDQRLSELTQALAAIPHIKRLRVHTRLPVVLPERVNDELLSWLVGTRLNPVVVVHANHPNEIDTSVRDAIRCLRDVDVTVLNQSVLLQGVNDNADTLCNLSEVLFDAGVLPYYLHLLDPVQGAAHFDVDETNATRLMEVIRTRLPGYLVPRLVRELPGAPYKVPIT